MLTFFWFPGDMRDVVLVQMVFQLRFFLIIFFDSEVFFLSSVKSSKCLQKKKTSGFSVT